MYAGDTHAAFGAMLANEGEDYVGAEYSCPGVTSPDREDGSVTPLELHNAAQLAANNVRFTLGLREPQPSTAQTCPCQK